MISMEQEQRLYTEARYLWEDYCQLSDALTMSDGGDQDLEEATDKAYDKFNSCCSDILGRELLPVERYRYFPSYDD